MSFFASVVPPFETSVITAVAIVVPIVPFENSSWTSRDLLPQFRPCFEKALHFGMAFEKFLVIDQLWVLSYLR